jgi:hypothetical protein
MSVLKFSAKPNAAASAKNVQYISRDSACDSLSFHNLDDLETGDRQGNKTNAIAYAEERAEQEADKRGDRNHYRMVITFDRDVPTEEAKRLTHQYLKENFPNSAAVVAIHQDKTKPDADKGKIRDQDHTHAHVWVDCRDLKTGRKLNITGDKFRTLDERWYEIHDREYKTDYYKEFTAKKRETAEWKREYVFAKKHNLPLPEKPERVADNYRAKQYREKDLRDLGVKPHDQRAGDRDQRFVTAGRSAVAASQQRIEQSERGFEQSKHALAERADSGNRADRAADSANQKFESTIRGAERAAKAMERAIDAPDTSRDFYDR